MSAATVGARPPLDRCLLAKAHGSARQIDNGANHNVIVVNRGRATMGIIALIG
jgi:hypothetical protein